MKTVANDEIELKGTIQIKITRDNGNLIVTGPFHVGNNAIYRQLCGRFSDGSWSLPDTPTAVDALSAQFGTLDSPVVELEVAGNQGSENCGAWTIGGYILASRRARDYAVQLAPGVRLIDGQFPGSAGSSKSPRVAADKTLRVSIQVRADFALRHELVIRPPVDGGAAGASAPTADLSAVTDAQLLAEISRRGYPRRPSHSGVGDHHPIPLGSRPGGGHQ